MTRAAGLLLAAAGMAASSVGAKPSVGARFLSVPVSVRQMAMGDVTVGDADVLRAWCNPAYLGTIESRAQIGFNGGTGDRAFQQAVAGGGGVRLGESFALGALLSYSGFTFNEVDAAGAEGLAVSRRSTALGLGGAWNLSWLHAGLTLKGVSEASPQDEVALSGAAADLGVLAETGGFSAAASVRNAGTPLATDTDVAGGVVMPGEFRAGVAYRWPRFLAGAEFATTGPGVGLTGWISDELALRAGAARLGRPDGAITFGFSALVVNVGALKNIGVDYAVQLQAPVAQHRLNLSVAFGPLPGAPAAK